MAAFHIRIHLLGRFDVRRADGTSIAESEFRTAKTADLLRILALSNGVPVRLDHVVELLWPDVSHARAMASVRTAASQIRRTIGVDCVARQPGALVLEGAWVDAEQFLSDAAAVQAAARADDHERAHTLSLACERLYHGDLHAHDERSGWIVSHREHLIQQRVRMLCDGAASAISLGLPSEARDLASTAVTIDRWSETAHRLLMWAYGELGEIGSALQVFETYRTALAEELGADPSAQTRDLHLRLLRGQPG